MQLDKKIDNLKNDLIRNTQKLVRIKSVQEEKRPSMPYGAGINDALITTLKLGEDLGFKTKNLDGHLGYIEWGEGKEVVGVLGHLDVVPEGDGWKHDPYGGEIEEGKIYGRGTLDNKGPVVSSIYGLYSLKETGFNPKKRIRILLGTDEENGCTDIKYYLDNEGKMDMAFTPDGYFPMVIAEKGNVVFNLTRIFNKAQNSSIVYIKGGKSINLVPDYCEVGIKIKDKEELMRKIDAYGKRKNFNLSYKLKDDLLILKSKGFEAQGYTPQFGTNAIMQAICFLYFSGVCQGEVKEVIDFLAKNINMEVFGKSLGINLHDDVSGNLLLNVGTIEMNENMISLGVNIRYPVTFKVDDVLNPLKEKVKNVGLEIKGVLNEEPLNISKESKVANILSKVYKDETGDNSKNIAVGSGTYAKKMPNTVAFGPIFPGKPDLYHKANEYIEIHDLVKMTKIYAKAIKEMAIN